MMKLFNKGRRTFALSGGLLSPAKFIEVDDREGEKLLKSYPREIVKESEFKKTPKDSQEILGLKKLIVDLKKENEDLKKDIEKVKKENDELKKSIGEKDGKAKKNA